MFQWAGNDIVTSSVGCTDCFTAKQPVPFAARASSSIFHSFLMACNLANRDGWVISLTEASFFLVLPVVFCGGCMKWSISGRWRGQLVLPRTGACKSLCNVLRRGGCRSLTVLSLAFVNSLSILNTPNRNSGSPFAPFSHYLWTNDASIRNKYLHMSWECKHT